MIWHSLTEFGKVWHLTRQDCNIHIYTANPKYSHARTWQHTSGWTCEHQLTFFEHFIGHQFHAVPQKMTLLQVKQFALLPAMAILCVLEIAPWRIMESKNLQISVSDTDRFDKLSRQTQNIKSATSGNTESSIVTTARYIVAHSSHCNAYDSIVHHCNLLWYCKTMALTVHNFVSAMYNLTSILVDRKSVV